MNSVNENVIEWVTGDNCVCVTLTSGKLKNKVLKLYESHTNDFKYLIKNSKIFLSRTR